MIDTFRTHARTLTSPPEHAIALVPNDVEDLEHVTRALYVGGSGDVALRLLGGSEVTLVNVPAGTFLPLRARRVLGVGTTASALVGFW